MKNPSAIVSPHSGSRFPKAPSVIEIQKRTLARHVAETIAGQIPNRAKRIEATVLLALLTFNGTVEAIVSAPALPTPKPGEYITHPEDDCPLF